MLNIIIKRWNVLQVSQVYSLYNDIVQHNILVRT